jgi:N-acetylglucosaminyldiphosphoundecaprenol N-acetyl-beta-D-mannosaminyltransferase
VFYLGASQNTLNLIEKRIQKEFSNIRMGSYSPPYKSEFSAADTNAMIGAVNNFKPDFLFVGMTAPKQEKWVFANKDSLDATVITSIGAVFDFYAGTVKRSSPFWIKIGLEWLPRLVREPKRLWKRNFISTPLFLLDLLKAKAS